MERRTHSPAQVSTYGLACMQCFKAKCRCVPRANGPCERYGRHFIVLFHAWMDLKIDVD